MENSVMEYKKLRLSTKDFKFNSKKEKGEFWDNLWMENSAEYKRTLKKFMDEDIHIKFSWRILTKWGSYGALFLSLGSLAGYFSAIVGLALIGVSFVSMLASSIINSKLEDTFFLNQATLGMLTPEVLESVSEDLKKLNEDETK